MRELVNRYLMHRQMHEEGQGVTEDDLNEIKGDISSFRYELLDILRENGMKMNTHDTFRKGMCIQKSTNAKLDYSMTTATISHHIFSVKT